MPAATPPDVVASPPDVVPEVPRHGRVVQVRGSVWAVTDVSEQRLLRSPADEGVPQLQHLVTLQNLGEDALGDEIEVIWELEVGHALAPDQGLPREVNPDAFDAPQHLGAFVDAARWGAVTSADDSSYQAPFRSGVNVEAFQLEPLRRALQSPRTNLLLADDVGLGKTIEAGLVIQELLLRHRARTAIVVCPPSLCVKWADEMRDKFGLDFVVVNSARMADLRRTRGLNANPFRLFPRTIVSMAWLRSTRAQRLLREVYADADASPARRFAFDLLVVDEAHHVAPASPSSGRLGYATDSDRTIYTRELANRCEHRLFLSATPHNGHSESFTALLEMIDNRRFSRGALVDEAALRDITVRRLKTEITSKNFQARHIEHLPFTPTAEEEEHFALLTTLLTASKKQRGKDAGGDLAAMLLKKRLLSSPVAFSSTLQQFEDAVVPFGAPAHALLFDDDDETLRDAVGSDEEEGDVDHPEFQALQARKVTHPLGTATRAEIGRLITWGESYRGRPDSRLKALIAYLNAIVRPGGTWSNERVVVFTEYAATLRWIVEILRSAGFGDRLAVIEGATDAESRELVRLRFCEDPSKEPVRILVATDAAGEGIDLQAFCHRLVNFDVPFNPSRIEQRIGRIDRYGQQHRPEVVYFQPIVSTSIYAADASFLSRLASKVSQVAADLGSANQVFDVELQNHFSPGRSRTVVQDATAAIINKTLAGGLELNRSLDALARGYHAIGERLHITPDAMQRVVATALELSNQPPLTEIGDERTDAAVFEVGHLSPQWQRSIEGLATRLRPDVRRPVTFDREALIDPETLAERTDLVALHLGHPLVARAARLLRHSLLTESGHRVTAVVVPGLDVSCVAAVSRLVLVGRGGLRLHEEVFVTGVRLGAQDLAEEKTQRLLDSALDSPDLTLADAGVRRHVAQLWNSGDRLRERLTTAVGRRGEARRADVAAQLRQRQDADVARARGIYAAFRHTLRDSIAELRRREDELSEMLPLPDDQRRQREKDLRAMEDRLLVLDDEERREVAAINNRYAEVEPFPASVALVFALTKADAASWGAAS